MTEETTEHVSQTDTPPDATPEGSDLRSEQDNSGSGSSDESETFPREVVEKLRQENGKYRQRARQADALATRLHTELVRATGRLADPTDLPYSEDHLADAEKMVAAIDELLEAKPHLATRRPSGDIGQGNRGGAAQPFSLLDMLKERT